MSFAGAAPVARLRSALFGIATRRATVEYLRLIALIMFILLTVAWTIDLARHFPALRAAADARDVPLIGLLAPYLTYRSADMITRMLPMACFFGVFLAEIGRRARLETVILATSGASPLRLLAAVLWVGLILGPVQSALEARWRPAAVFAQVDLGFGDYAQRFRRGWFGPVWFVSGDTAVRGEVLRRDPPEMRNVLVFRGIRSDRLRNIYAAERMLPTGVPFQWRLEGVTRWQARTDGGDSEAAPGALLTLDLVPEQLTYVGVGEFYQPTGPLKRLATMTEAPTALPAAVAIWRRWTVWLLPGTLALLAVSLANAGFEGRSLHVPRLIALAASGYLLVVSVKVFWALGELGVLSAAAAVLLSVAICMILSAILIWREA